jgi:hypothetical protein
VRAEVRLARRTTWRVCRGSLPEVLYFGKRRMPCGDETTRCDLAAEAASAGQRFPLGVSGNGNRKLTKPSEELTSPRYGRQERGQPVGRVTEDFLA